MHRRVCECYIFISRSLYFSSTQLNWVQFWKLHESFKGINVFAHLRGFTVAVRRFYWWQTWFLATGGLFSTGLKITTQPNAAHGFSSQDPTQPGTPALNVCLNPAMQTFSLPHVNSDDSQQITYNFTTYKKGSPKARPESIA